MKLNKLNLNYCINDFYRNSYNITAALVRRSKSSEWAGTGGGPSSGGINPYFHCSIADIGADHLRECNTADPIGEPPTLGTTCSG
jgi:hypothetical protein